MTREEAKSLKVGDVVVDDVEFGGFGGVVQKVEDGCVQVQWDDGELSWLHFDNAKWFRIGAAQ